MLHQSRLDQLVQSAEEGDASAREQLFTVLYNELHRLAQRELRRGATGPSTISAVPWTSTRVCSAWTSSAT